MDDLVFYSKGKVEGVIAPSTLYGSLNSEKLLNGPKGITRILHDSEPALQDALIKCGSLISGSKHEVELVQLALHDPQTSRTISYLLCHAKKCSDVLNDLADIRSAKVVIAGCGGIGSTVALLLAGSGVKSFTLIDPDIIEESNLNRQLFWTLEDVGAPKVDTLESVLRCRFKELEIEVEQAEVSIVDLVKRCSDGVSALAVTADNPGTLASDSRLVCSTCGIPVVGGGYMHKSMLLFSFAPGTIDQIEDSSPHINWDRLPSSIMPSYGPMNLSLASQIASTIIASLASRTLGSQKSAVVRWDMDSINHVFEMR